MRVPTSATEWASVASVLRPWPVENTLARAESFGRHVDHVLLPGQEPRCDMPADPVASLDRPDPVRPLLHVLDHRREAVDISAEATTTEDLLAGSHHLDRHRPLVRVHPDHDSLTCRHPLLLRSDPVGRVERAPLP